MATTSSDPAGDAVLLALTEVIKGATSPEIQQAQAMLLRRLATQGDVIPSRIPAPLNITQVGGYFNLLTDLAETTMRKEMLGAALGLATASVAAGAGGSIPPMHLTSLANDRPAGAAGAAVPLSVAVREDLAAGVTAMVASIHAAGGVLPLWSPPHALPPSTGTSMPPGPMPYLGRELWLAPTAALTDPATDPIVLGRAATDPAPGYRVGIRVADGTVGAPKLDWTGLVWDTIGGAFVERALGQVTLLPIEAALATTPFAAHRLTVAPGQHGDYEWARLTAVAGLVPGASRLGDELALLWTSQQITDSAYAAHVDALWDGTRFVG